ncbi:hypothetical protein [Pseudomonas rhodesiae]|uniref:hypothetical protein n=1 Tax=Pseudomonas rhodesiae TaxID=76760 RepID=UPI0028A222B6|nr:hypothetical protein [Pseudomonas rhodesiae]
MKSRDELNLRFTTDVCTLDRFQFGSDEEVTAEIFGDPEKSSYEWRLVHTNGLVEQHSDCGYGVGLAMRDALVIFYGTSKFGGDLVDLRPTEHEPRHWGELKGKAPSIALDLIEAADTQLDSLSRDAERYRVLREHWLRIEDKSTAHRAGGLDLWCDERLPASKDQLPKS